MRFVITGTPGSGTRYITQVFDEMNLFVGHEQMFKHGFPDGRLRLTKGAHVGEASWYAVPFLPLLDMPTVHQTRHPLLNIRTLVGMEHWRTNTYHQPMFHELTPRVFDYDDPILWSARFWLDWNGLAESCSHRWDVATVTPDQMFWALREADIITHNHQHIAFALGKVPKTGGDRQYGYDLDYDDLGPMADEVRDRAGRYGYL